MINVLFKFPDVDVKLKKVFLKLNLNLYETRAVAIHDRSNVLTFSQAVSSYPSQLRNI